MAHRFSGAYYRALDAKGRLLLPPSFLKALESESGGRSFWLTGFYGRLTAYLPEQWNDIVEKLCSVRMPSRNLANFKSKVIGLAREIEPDNQGRARVPQTLAREAGLTRDAVLVGILDKFEIWDQARFDALSAEDVSDELGERGLDLSL